MRLRGLPSHCQKGLQVRSEAEQTEVFALATVRRHVRILVDISRLADEVTEVDRGERCRWLPSPTPGGSKKGTKHVIARY
jgi:hypothetical protein